MRSILTSEKEAFFKGINSVEDILSRSSRATCGIMEREVTVPLSKVTSTVNKLQRAGYQVLGTSHGKGKNKKIWFIIQGGI